MTVLPVIVLQANGIPLFYRNEGYWVNAVQERGSPSSMRATSPLLSPRTSAVRADERSSMSARVARERAL